MKKIFLIFLLTTTATHYSSWIQYFVTNSLIRWNEACSVLTTSAPHLSSYFRKVVYWNLCWQVTKIWNIHSILLSRQVELVTKTELLNHSVNDCVDWVQWKFLSRSVLMRINRINKWATKIIKQRQIALVDTQEVIVPCWWSLKFYVFFWIFDCLFFDYLVLVVVVVPLEAIIVRNFHNSTGKSFSNSFYWLIIIKRNLQAT